VGDCQRDPARANGARGGEPALEALGQVHVEPGTAFVSRSQSGRRFLESATTSEANPSGRILNAIQAGAIAALAGGAMLIVRTEERFDWMDDSSWSFAGPRYRLRLHLRNDGPIHCDRNNPTPA